MAGSPGADFCHVFSKVLGLFFDLPLSKSGRFEEEGSLFSNNIKLQMIVLCKKSFVYPFGDNYA